jgi:hypothetical protein
MTSAWVAGLPLIAGAVVLARVVTRRGRCGIYTRHRRQAEPGRPEGAMLVPTP